jgi:hypothetical protein
MDRLGNPCALPPACPLADGSTASADESSAVNRRRALGCSTRGRLWQALGPSRPAMATSRLPSRSESVSCYTVPAPSTQWPVELTQAVPSPRSSSTPYLRMTCVVPDQLLSSAPAPCPDSRQISVPKLGLLGGSVHGPYFMPGEGPQCLRGLMSRLTRWHDWLDRWTDAAGISNGIKYIL